MPFGVNEILGDGIQLILWPSLNSFRTCSKDCGYPPSASISPIQPQQSPPQSIERGSPSVSSFLPHCSGQLNLATVLEFNQNLRSDSFGLKPAL